MDVLENDMLKHGIAENDYELIIKSLFERPKFAKTFEKIENIKDFSIFEYGGLIAEAIKNADTLDLSKNEILTLIKSIKDYKKETGFKGVRTTYINSIFLGYGIPTELSKEDIMDFVIQLDDIGYIEQFVKANGFSIASEIYRENFSTQDKADVIAKSINRNFIDDLLNENEKVDLGRYGKSRIIHQLIEHELEEIPQEQRDDTRKHLLKKYMDQYGGALSDADKVALIWEMNDEAYMKYAVENTILESEEEKISLVIGTGDYEYIQQYLKDNNDKIDINNVERLVNSLKTKQPKLFEDFNSQILQIDNIAEFDLEYIKNNPNITMIRITNENMTENSSPLYRTSDFIKLKDKMEQLLNGIDPAEQGNVKSELDTFLKVYERLANHIVYDDFATSYNGINDLNIKKTRRSLKCLLDNKDEKVEVVCEGVQELLRNGLALKNVKCKGINGLPEHSDEGHAWNQVCIGNKWFNVDLTMDREKILSNNEVTPEVLRIDNDFTEHNVYSRNRSVNEEKCDTSIAEVLAQYDNEIEKEKTDANEVDNENLQAEKINTKTNFRNAIKKLADKFSIRSNEIIHSLQRVKEIYLSYKKNKNRDIYENEK